MRIKGLIRTRQVWKKKYITIFATHIGDFEIPPELQLRLDEFLSKTPYWEAEVQDGKVVRFIRPFVPRKIREAIKTYVPKAVVLFKRGAFKNYCSYCGRLFDVEDVLFLEYPTKPKIYLCPRCARKLLSPNEPVIVPVNDNNKLTHPLKEFTIVPLRSLKIIVPGDEGGPYTLQNGIHININRSIDETMQYQEGSENAPIRLSSTDLFVTKQRKEELRKLGVRV